jgi:hypothetical protein
MTKTATVSAKTTARSSANGKPVKILPGRYEVVDIDGAADRGVAYVVSTAGTLVAVSLTDHLIDIKETA